MSHVRFRPGYIGRIKLLLVIALLRCFFTGFSGFPPILKSQNFQIQIRLSLHKGPAWKPARADVAYPLILQFIYLFTYLFIDWLIDLYCYVFFNFRWKLKQPNKDAIVKRRQNLQICFCSVWSPPRNSITLVKFTFYRMISRGVTAAKQTNGGHVGVPNQSQGIALYLYTNIVL